MKKDESTHELLFFLLPLAFDTCCEVGGLVADEFPDETEFNFLLLVGHPDLLQSIRQGGDMSVEQSPP